VATLLRVRQCLAGQCETENAAKKHHQGNAIRQSPIGAEQLNPLRTPTRLLGYMLLQELFDVSAESASIFLRELFKFGL
jgi:hypothetical protein